MDTWSRLTALRWEGVGRLEEISQRTYIYTCIAHGHRQQHGDGWGQRVGAGWRGAEGRTMGNIFIGVNNKNSNTNIPEVAF